MGGVEEEGGPDRVTFVSRGQHSLSNVSTAARFGSRIPSRPPLHDERHQENEQEQIPPLPRQIKGRQNVDLTWSGAGSINVDIVRDGDVVATVANALGEYTDNIGAKGGATYTYAVCEAGTSICSEDTMVVF